MNTFLSRYIICSYCDKEKAEFTVKNENTNTIRYLCEKCITIPNAVHGKD